MRGFDCSPVFGLFDKGLFRATVRANDEWGCGVSGFEPNEALTWESLLFLGGNSTIRAS